jgi:hypothetical protein
MCVLGLLIMVGSLVPSPHDPTLGGRTMLQSRLPERYKPALDLWSVERV